MLVMVNKKDQLSKINLAIAKCQRCLLYKTAHQSVPGEGNPEAKVVFIGEAPGYYEDLQGRPFVGAAGQFLNKALKLVGLRREDVFICNVIKHRPPNNRDPQDSEIEACRVWLDKQLEIIEPKVVVTLGRFSLSYFLPAHSISKVHGKVFNLGRLILLPLFHPAAALRNQNIERQFLEDIKKLPAVLSNEVKGKNETSSQLNLF